MSKAIDRIRKKTHLDFVRSLPCCVTGANGVHAHHLIGHGQGGMGLKSSDMLAIPLSPEIHGELHNHGWKAWEEKYGSQWEFVTRTLLQAIEEDYL